MSSGYSSRWPSLSDPEPSLPVSHAIAKSVPETPARVLQRPVFHTVPDSPKENPLLPDDHGLDLSILTHKLQLYQLEIEEAELRRKHNKIARDKHAAEVAAAARFRDELEKGQRSPLFAKMEEEIDMQTRSMSMRKSQASEPRSRSSSVYSSGARGPRSRSTSLRQSEDALPESSLPPVPVPRPMTAKSYRTKRPQPLLLPDSSVAPQEIRSAALPTPRTRESTTDVAQMKKHWRRTTISAGRHSKIVLLTSDGKPEYCEFDIPPLPQLSSSVSTMPSPPTMSPVTPLPGGPTEDQIRRELETFALEEGPNIQMSRRSSVSSRRRIPVAFVPDPEDRMLPGSRPPPPPKIPSSFVEPVIVSVPPPLPPVEASTLGRTKSFFHRFERKTDVDSLLDLYMTDDQLNEAKAQKKKDTRLKRQTFFKKLQPTDALFHRAEKPG